MIFFGSSRPLSCTRLANETCAFQGVKLPSTTPPTSTTSPSTPLTTAALTSQARALDESALAHAFGHRSTTCTTADSETETDLETEMGQLEAGWAEVVPDVAAKPSLWGLLSGSQRVVFSGPHPGVWC